MIIPCQRVVASTDRLTGFASGIGIKRFLFELEEVQIAAGNKPELDVVITRTGPHVRARTLRNGGQ